MGFVEDRRACEEQTVIKVHKFYKLMQLLLRLGLKEISNSLNFLMDKGNTLSINMMFEESSSVTPSGHLLQLMTVPCMVRQSKMVYKS